MTSLVRPSNSPAPFPFLPLSLSLSLSAYVLLPNHILAPPLPHPHLMHASRIDVDPTPHAERLFRRLLVPRVGDGHFAPADQVGGQAAVGVWGVVCVAVGEGGGGEG